jgi:tetratricopeptide (TPR) repeat protein
VIEIYDITNGKLKYSAYSFWQLCEMMEQDYAYHAEEEDGIVRWVEQKAEELCREGREKDIRERVEKLAMFGETNGHRGIASRLKLFLGEMASGGGDHESAIGHFEKAVSLVPQDVKALHRLAKELSAMGLHHRAAEVLRKANGIFPSEQAHVALAAVLEKLNGPKDREKTLRSLLRNYPRSISGMHMLVQFYRQRGKKRAAARLVQRIVDLRPEREDRPEPFLGEFTDALIWSKYIYEARKAEGVLASLDEEQGRNPHAWLSLLKAVMVYKLDKRLCREECCCELAKYFRGVEYDKEAVATSLREIVEVFGEEFSRGVVRFIKGQFAKSLLRRERREHAPEISQTLSPAEPCNQLVPGHRTRNLRNGVKT